MEIPNGLSSQCQLLNDSDDMRVKPSSLVTKLSSLTNPQTGATTESAVVDGVTFAATLVVNAGRRTGLRHPSARYGRVVNDHNLLRRTRPTRHDNSTLHVCRANDSSLSMDQIIR